MAELNVCFVDGTCFDLSKVYLSSKDLSNASAICDAVTPYAPWKICCAISQMTSDLLFTDNATNPLFNVGLLSELYTMGFGCVHFTRTRARV
jgi:hypothetical protein